jgi:hypothetical protein
VRKRTLRSPPSEESANFYHAPRADKPAYVAYMTGRVGGLNLSEQWEWGMSKD